MNELTIKGLKLDNGQVTQELFYVTDSETLEEAIEAVEDYIIGDVLTYGEADKWSFMRF